MVACLLDNFRRHVTMSLPSWNSGAHWRVFGLQFGASVPGFIRGALRVGPYSVMEDFSHHLEDILHRMKIEILKEHDHEVQIAKLRTKALMGAMTANHWWASKHDPKNTEDESWCRFSMRRAVLPSLSLVTCIHWGKSGDLTLGVPAAQHAQQARKMLQRMRTADLEKRKESSSKETSSKARRGLSCCFCRKWFVDCCMIFEPFCILLPKYDQFAA